MTFVEASNRVRVRGGRFGILAVALAVIALMVVSIIGSFATDRSAARLQRALVLNNAYQEAARGVAAEESLERKYRLEPGPDPLVAHREARLRVRTALGDVQRLGTSTDRQLATKVLSEHERYERAAVLLFAAVDRHEPTSVLSNFDTQSVDPVFRAMQTEIYAAAAGHQAAALAEITAVRHTDGIVLGVDSATLLAGVLLIAAAAVALARYRSRLLAQSDLNRYQALHDTLTGLPNRTLFEDRTAQALRTAQRSGTDLAVMLIDINRFKDVNDTLGHHFGDLLLGQIAQRFSATVRAGDTVARFGGDEFAVLVCDTSLDDAVSVAQRLADALSDAFTVKDISLDVEVSIGITVVGPDADVDTALRHADVAMYEAKTQHLPYATYELTRDDHTLARLALLGDLRRAIGGGELVLQYQPKVSTNSGALHGVEALVRWNHPTRGLLMPADFIPIAEGTAVIHPLTDEILRQALVQARAWFDRGWTIPVAVNISARSLHDLGLPAKVQRQLDAVGVPSSLLTLELTEGAIMIDPARALRVLEALSDMGVCLSIDDFGTGYSSMSYLKDLPVRELKIDRSFVMNMNHDDGDRVLVKSAVDLGHNLGLHVVAEGVEDAATQDALRAMGCDLMQGYHIRRPASAADLEPWLAEIISPDCDPLPFEAVAD